MSEKTNDELSQGTQADKDELKERGRQQVKEYIKELGDMSDIYAPYKEKDSGDIADDTFAAIYTAMSGTPEEKAARKAQKQEEKEQRKEARAEFKEEEKEAAEERKEEREERKEEREEKKAQQ